MQKKELIAEAKIYQQLIAAKFKATLVMCEREYKKNR